MSKLGHVLESAGFNKNLKTGVYAQVHNHMIELERFTQEFPLISTWLEGATGKLSKFKERNGMLCGRIASKEAELMAQHVKEYEQGGFMRIVVAGGVQYQFKSPESSQAFAEAWTAFLKTPCTYEI